MLSLRISFPVYQKKNKKLKRFFKGIISYNKSIWLVFLLGLFTLKYKQIKTEKWRWLMLISWFWWTNLLKLHLELQEKGSYASHTVTCYSLEHRWCPVFTWPQGGDIILHDWQSTQVNHLRTKLCPCCNSLLKCSVNIAPKRRHCLWSWPSDSSNSKK